MRRLWPTSSVNWNMMRCSSGRMLASTYASASVLPKPQLGTSPRAAMAASSAVLWSSAETGVGAGASPDSSKLYAIHRSLRSAASPSSGSRRSRWSGARVARVAGSLRSWAATSRASPTADTRPPRSRPEDPRCPLPSRGPPLQRGYLGVIGRSARPVNRRAICRQARSARSGPPRAARFAGPTAGTQIASNAVQATSEERGKRMAQDWIVTCSAPLAARPAPQRRLAAYRRQLAGQGVGH